MAESWVFDGAKPKRSYCSSKTLPQSEPPWLSSSQWSNLGSFGVFARTDSFGLVPGNAATATPGTTSTSASTARVARILPLTAAAIVAGRSARPRQLSGRVDVAWIAQAVAWHVADRHAVEHRAGATVAAQLAHSVEERLLDQYGMSGRAAVGGPDRERVASACTHHARDRLG